MLQVIIFEYPLLFCEQYIYGLAKMVLPAVIVYYLPVNELWFSVEILLVFYTPKTERK